VGHLEGPLTQAAQQLGYRRDELSDILVLWIR